MASIKVTMPNGEIWEFPSLSDALEFRRGSAGTDTPQATPSAPRRRGRPPGRQTRERRPRAGKLRPNGKADVSDGSKQILRAMLSVGTEGIINDKFAVLIGSANVRKVPVRMMVLAREMKALGFRPEDVIGRERIYIKSKAKSVFKAGPKLAEAIKAVGLGTADLF